MHLLKRKAANKTLRRAICFLMVFVLLAFELSAFAVAAPASSAKKTAAQILETGVYRIKNLQTGKFMDFYDVVYDRLGTAYLDDENGGLGQEIYVEKQEDGTYVLYPQSEDGEYALSAKDGTGQGAKLAKSKKISKKEYFDIYAAVGSGYTISPAYFSDNTVLVASSKKTKYNDNYIELEKYSATKNQRWSFEPVAIDGISLAYSKTTVKLYSVGTLYATLTPYNFTSSAVTWKSSNEKLLVIDKNGTYCALKPGTVTVTALCEGKRASCEITISTVSAFTWYSQHNVSGSDWDGTGLSNLYFSSGGARKKFAVDKSGGKDWLEEGCYLTSIAMVLHNMGATLETGYDLRSGQTNNLPADPYTVALANSGNIGVRNAKSVMYGNPILVSRSKIESRFKVDGRAIESSVSYDVSNKAIKEALDEHPEGVIVYFSKYSGRQTHYIVFTKCLNPTEKNPANYRFEVCDSAAYNASQGDHVPFEECISYVSRGQKYRMSNAVSILTFDVVK